ncbi:MAG: DUF512 domain-containing protein, partial [Candidatus Subteraquimicrobiales bacterium]|nr:DUF512 domain-containing protein [Candidatus Subteraquimicrobiales bacterium]
MQNRAVVSEVSKNSLAHRISLQTGDIFLKINNKPLLDIIDYHILSEETDFSALILRGNNLIHLSAKKQVNEPIGLKFTSSIFNGVKICKNRCIFCFIDQLPKGLRKSLYLKDDDYRLSFLYGNFITLTNLQEKDVERIIKNRLSPLYVSLHTTDSRLRKRMLCPKRKDKALEYLNYLLENGIEIHIQIVLCAGVNDGKALIDTLSCLRQNFGKVASVGIVPVGLTKYREKMFPLRLFTKTEIKSLIKYIKDYQQKIKEEKGIYWVYLADEFYLRAKEKLPSFSEYDSFPQLENGIGFIRLFLDGVEKAVSDIRLRKNSEPITVLTGELAAPILEGVAIKLKSRFILDVRVVKIFNNFFGRNITVAGLIT